MIQQSASKRRSHSKIAQLPPKLRKAINKQLLSGRTYDEITKYLEEMQENISRASVARYGKNFHAKMEKLSYFRDQAKLIMDSAGNRQSSEMHEALRQMAISTLMERIMEIEDLKDAKGIEAIKALAVLERVGIQSDKLKLLQKKESEEARLRKKTEGASETELEDDGLLAALENSARDVWKDS